MSEMAERARLRSRIESQFKSAIVAFIGEALT